MREPLPGDYATFTFGVLWFVLTADLVGVTMSESIVVEWVCTIDVTS